MCQGVKQPPFAWALSVRAGTFSSLYRNAWRLLVWEIRGFRDIWVCLLRGDHEAPAMALNEQRGALSK